MSAKRNSNIEWIRIVAILLITFNHIYNKGVDKAVVLSEYGTVNAAISVFFLMGGKYGCNLFLIISAWFLAEKEFDWRPALRIWVQTVFYSLVLDVVSAVFFKADLSKRDILSIFLPLTVGTYWYSTAYVAMLLLGPFVRGLFNRCGKLRPVLIIAGAVAFSVVPTLTLEGTVFKGSKPLDLLFSALTFPPVWFLYVYVLIGYIKAHRFKSPKPGVSLAIAVALYVGMFFITLPLFRGVGSGRFPDTWKFSEFRQMNSPICLLSAYCLFMAARDAKPTSATWVNRFAGYTYGIYLFQCHSVFQDILWRDILKFERYFHTSVPAFVLYSVFGVGVIVVLGFALEWVYKRVDAPLQMAIRKR